MGCLKVQRMLYIWFNMANEGKWKSEEHDDVLGSSFAGLPG